MGNTRCKSSCTVTIRGGRVFDTRARGHRYTNGRGVLVFAALGFMGAVWVAVIAVVTGCLEARPGSDAQDTQARDCVGNHTDETLLKAMAEADEVPQVRPTPEGAGGEARDCVDCHADVMHLKAIAQAEEAPPADTSDG